MRLLRDRESWTDAELLAAIARCDDRAFSTFYRRHLQLVVGWCLRRTRDPELTADLTAEVFAAVLIAAAQYRADHESAAGWVLGIARNVLGHSIRRVQVDARARRRLGAPALAVEDTDLSRVLDLGSARGPATGHLAGLPAAERAAVHARVIEERDYDEIARALGCSELVVRKRVSRGLARLRAQLARP